MSKLDTLVEQGGVIHVGWVSETVLFAHFRGTLGPKLKERYRRAMESRLARRSEAYLFCDTRRIDSALSVFDILSPTFQEQCTSLLDVRLLVRSHLAGLTGSATALLHRLPLRQTRSRSTFRAWLRQASVHGVCDFDSERNLPITNKRFASRRS